MAALVGGVTQRHGLTIDDNSEISSLALRRSCQTWHIGHVDSSSCLRSTSSVLCGYEYYRVYEEDVLFILNGIQIVNPFERWKNCNKLKTFLP